ncbi:MAG TPA: UDP-N-acetylmuramate dehydrogenase [Limnobacter sp.]|nr:UDP-N-acetylmuramate dehydrogenase [Limnobacter sp.]
MSCTPATHCVDLQPLHTFALPAKATGLRVIRSSADLQEMAQHQQAGERQILLGEGSNTVFVEPVIHATVWKMGLTGRQYLGIYNQCHNIRVMAGENWHQTVEWTVAMGWGGLENLALIPGSVGAGPVQNIGAYGLELKDRVSAVHAFDLAKGTGCSFSLEECQFGYRDSLFKSGYPGRYVITAIDFALPVAWQPMLGYGDVAQRVKDIGPTSPASVLRAVCAIRTEKLPDPAVLGNCGSFFKNPVIGEETALALLKNFPQLVHYPAGQGLVKLAAGWLIDQCGLRGFSTGGVGVYSRQALILVNQGNGQAEHLLSLVGHVQEQVHLKFGVQLEPEVNLVFSVPTRQEAGLPGS